eukprot:2801700-Amphidinium_carterae.1
MQIGGRRHQSVQNSKYYKTFEAPLKSEQRTLRETPLDHLFRFCHLCHLLRGQLWQPSKRLQKTEVGGRAIGKADIPLESREGASKPSTPPIHQGKESPQHLTCRTPTEAPLQTSDTQGPRGVSPPPKQDLSAGRWVVGIVASLLHMSPPARACLRRFL